MPAPAGPAQTAPATAAAAGAPDLALMRKAFAVFRAPALQIDSASTLEMRAKGVVITMHLRHNVVAKRDGRRFRANFVLASEGDSTSGTRYVVVGDATKVFTHRPGANQYAAQARKAWDAGDDDVPVLGLLASTYLDGSFADLASALDAADEKTFLSEAKKHGASVSGAPTGQNGVEGYVFTIKPADAPTFRLFVDPQTGALRQFELAGREGGTSITLTEAVSRLSTSPVSLTPATFAFAPPAGAKKVKTLAVDVFP